MAPSHYLHQCWLIISKALWHSPVGNLTGNAPDICLWYEFDDYLLKSTIPSLRGHWVKDWSCLHFYYWPNLLMSFWCHQTQIWKMVSWFKYCKIIPCSHMKNDDLIRSQMCTYHDSWAVMACANLWTNWIFKSKNSLRLYHDLTKFSEISPR